MSNLNSEYEDIALRFPVDKKVEKLHKGLWKWQNENNNFTCIIFHYSATEREKEWIENKKRLLSPTAFLQEFCLSFDVVAEGKRVFPGFSDIHIKEIEADRNYEIIRGWDFGFLHSAVLFAQKDKYQQLRVLEEVYLENAYTKDLVLKVLGISNKYRNFVFIDVCDPKAGKQRSEKSEKTNIEILRSYGVEARPAPEEPVASGINKIALLLEKKVGKERGLVVSPKCQLLIEGFKGGYVYDEDGEPCKEGIYSHIFDCLRYIVVSQYSIQEIVEEIEKIEEEKEEDLQKVWEKFLEEGKKQKSIGDYGFYL